MTGLATALVGTWRLESWSVVYQDGRPAEFPLGEDPVGYLMYTIDGHVSAALARVRRQPFDANDSASKARAFDEFFGYAGRFEVRERAILHKIDISSHPAVSGVTSLRDVVVSGDRLILSGPDFSPDLPRSHRIVWRRAG
jgi:Lipocalin-like domain